MLRYKEPCSFPSFSLCPTPYLPFNVLHLILIHSCSLLAFNHKSKCQSLSLPSLSCVPHSSFTALGILLFPQPTCFLSPRLQLLNTPSPPRTELTLHPCEQSDSSLVLANTWCTTMYCSWSTLLMRHSVTLLSCGVLTVTMSMNIPKSVTVGKFLGHTVHL